MDPSNDIDEGNNGGVDNKGPWLSGKKRPNKGRSHTPGRSIHPDKHTGISKQVIPANQLKIPTWDPVSGRWGEGKEKVYNEESKHTQLYETSEIRGRNKDKSLFSRLVSSSSIKPWREYTIIRVQSRRPSHLRPLGQGGRRTHKHKRKNKHTRRRRVQRRRA